MSKDKMIAWIEDEIEKINTVDVDDYIDYIAKRVYLELLNKINSGEFDEEGVKSDGVKLVMELEEHVTVGNVSNNPCIECALKTGILGCLDKSLCRYKKTGKTWERKLTKPKPPANAT